MDRIEIFNRVKACINTIKPIDVIMEEDYVDSRNVGFSSLQFLTFIVKLEEEFNIEFEDEELTFERYQKISDFINEIERKQNRKLQVE